MECSFCGEEMEPGEGKIFITKDGKRYPYCSSKCEKNHRELGKKPKTTKWAEGQ